MCGEALYERYKDALRRGHVASLRGRLEEALTAYAEAAAIAPERATPHTSAGTALVRRKRHGDALRHYDAALRLAPRDEAALLGRAQALAASTGGRRRATPTTRRPRSSPPTASLPTRWTPAARARAGGGPGAAPHA
jgi:tetratricopeptide (TPR) repeat protein